MKHLILSGKKLGTFLIFCILTNWSLFAQVADVSALKQQAKSGDAFAQFKLGKIYYEGKIEKQNFKKAAKLFENAATQNYDSALYYLGMMHIDGKGVKQDFNMAAMYLKNAAKKKNTDAIVALAELNEKGLGVQQNTNEAIRLHLQGWKQGSDKSKVALKRLPVDSYPTKGDPFYIYYTANQGDSVSMYNLAKIYETGSKDFEKDLKQAFRYYKRSSDRGYSEAKFKTAEFLANGKGVTKDLERALILWIQLANDHKKEAINILHEYDIDEYVHSSNLDYLIYKANSGEAYDQFLLYEKYLNGNGVQANVDKALVYLKKAAELDYENAVMTLARLYNTGTLVKQDPKEAAKWYKKASYLDNDTARYMLGEMYSIGHGVEKNDGRAVRYYIKAANNGLTAAQEKLELYSIDKYLPKNHLDYVTYHAIRGDVNAQLGLGEFYYEKEMAECIRWLEDAANNGQVKAQILLGRIYYKGLVGQIVDLNESLKWYDMALDAKSQEAIKSSAFIHFELSEHPKDEHAKQGYTLAKVYLNSLQHIPSEELNIYLKLANISFANENFPETHQYTNTYIQKQKDFPDSVNTDLHKAFLLRSKTYMEERNYLEASKAIQIGLLKLQQDRSLLLDEEPSIDTKELEGTYYYQSAKVMVKLDNRIKACKDLSIAQTLGVNIDAEYLDYCSQ